MYITYFQVTGTPCGQLTIAMAAFDITNVNFGFKLLNMNRNKSTVFLVFVSISGSIHVQTYG